MKKLEDQYVLKTKICTLDEESLKKYVFSGKIILIKKSDEIIQILNQVENHLSDYFNSSVYKIRKEFNYNNEHNKLFSILQNRIKNCKIIKRKFTLFLRSIGLKTSLTYMDLITFRFSPCFGKRAIGILNPAQAHRDTWASNIFNQINFWFPLHNVEHENSIFIVPEYFSKAVKNNSDTWSFKKYKKLQNYSSVPISSQSYLKKEVLTFKLNRGEVICFSGHHLHGSNVGKKNRMNLETRIVSKIDEKNYRTPENLDSYSKKVKNRWFRNIDTNEYYP